MSDDHDSGSSRYSTRVFIVSARDAKGHSERAFCRIQPMHARQVDEILGDRRCNFPYRSKGDLYRHAIVRHIEWLKTLAPQISVRGQVDALVEILREEEYNQDFITLFDALQKTTESHIAHGRTAQARRLVWMAKQHIEQMTEEDTRERYLAELTARYGHLLNGVGITLVVERGTEREDVVEGCEGENDEDHE